MFGRKSSSGRTYEWSDGTVHDHPEQGGGRSKSASSGSDPTYERWKDENRKKAEELSKQEMAAFEQRCVGLCTASRRWNLTSGAETTRTDRREQRVEPQGTPIEIPQGIPVEIPQGIPVEKAGGLIASLFGKRR